MKLKKYGATESKVLSLISPIAENLNLKIWDVRFVKDGASWYLRIFIDKDGGITLDDCEALSRPANKLLDEVDPIDQSYFFEVGSCGIERSLFRNEHFEVYIGKNIFLRLIRPKDDRKDFKGTLLRFDKESFTINEDGTEITFAFSDTAFVNAASDDEIQTF